MSGKLKILIILVDAARHEEGLNWLGKKDLYAYAPATLTTLASLVPAELDAEVRIIDEGVDSLPSSFNADIVGLSATTANAPRAYEVAAEARRQGAKTVLGGYHATLCPEEAARYVDTVVIGFAEESWPKVLRDYAAGQMKRQYAMPWRSIFSSEDKPIPRHELLKKKAYLLTATLECSRGCTNNCSFCCVPPTHDGRYQSRSVDNIISEVKALRTKTVSFLDANHYTDRTFAYKLYKSLSILGVSWYSPVTVEAASDPQWIEAAAKSGCKGVLIGFESLCQESLSGAGKHHNDIGVYLDTCRRLHDNGIAILGCFVFGLKGDTPGIFDDTLEFVHRASIDIGEYAILTPYPGTREFQRLEKENRILTKNWRHYDGRHAVFRHATMKPEELEEGLCRVWHTTYSFPSIFKRLSGTATSILFYLAANLSLRRYGRKWLTANNLKVVK